MAQAPTQADVDRMIRDLDPEPEPPAERSSVTLTMTLPSGVRESRTLRFDELGPRDDLECRKETGFPIQPFFSSQNAIGTDGVLVLWWAAGRKAGKRETFTQLCDLFPTYEAIGRADIDVDVEESGDPLG